MHAVVCLLVAFWNAVPATATAPAKPESVHSATAIVMSQAECDALGQATVSSLLQTPGVGHAGYLCVPVENPHDKPV